MIEQAKNTLSNKDYINVESWVRNVDYKYSNAINEGFKGFVKGGEKSGSYLVLGEPKQNEPIFNRTLQGDYKRIIKIIGYCSQDAAEWVKSWQRIDELLKIKPILP